MSSRRRSWVLRWATGLLVLALAAGFATLRHEHSDAVRTPGQTARSTAPVPTPGPTPAVPPVVLAKGADRPNVMLVMTDDIRWDELRYMPHVRQYVEDRGLRVT